MGAIKTRHPDDLQRAIHRIRELNNDFRDEFKFGRIKAPNYRIFSDLVDVLEDSDAHIAATVVDAGIYNPFTGKQVWEAHAEIISQLVAGNLNKGEIAAVNMDGITTPVGTSLGTTVKNRVNHHFRSIAVVHAVSLDSHANELLQAADLVAGAVYHQRMASRTRSPEKAKIAQRLAAAFGVADLSDHRTKRVNIATLRGAPGNRRRVKT